MDNNRVCHIDGETCFNGGYCSNCYVTNGVARPAEAPKPNDPFGLLLERFVVNRLKLVLGWFCYWPVMWCPQPWNMDNKLFCWMLSWAGYYAYSE